jgi:hypothetical protein
MQRETCQLLRDQFAKFYRFETLLVNSKPTEVVVEEEEEQKYLPPDEP